MHIVVLGGDGFIGRCACSKLIESGHHVVSVARRPQIPACDKLTYVESSYDNFTLVGEHLHSADCVVHLAWDTTPGASVRQASLEVNSNLLPLARLLDQLSGQRNTHLLYVSSGGALYGNQPAPALEHEDPQDTPCTETTPANPISYYGAGKGAGELFLKAFSAQSKLPITILRPSNIYGPGQEPRRGFAVIPTLLRAMQRGTPFTVRGEGRYQRDYLYIDDFIGALVACIDHFATSAKTRIFNVCSERAVSLIDLIEIARKVTGRRTEIRYEEALDVDIPNTLLSSSAIQRDTGWRAATSLEIGLDNTWRWIQERE